MSPYLLRRGVSLSAQRYKGSAVNKSRRHAGRERGSGDNTARGHELTADLVPAKGVFCLNTVLAHLASDRTIDQRKVLRDRFLKQAVLNDVGEGRLYSTIAAVPFYHLVHKHHYSTFGLPIEHLARWMNVLFSKSQDGRAPSNPISGDAETYIPLDLLGMRRVHITNMDHIDNQLRLLDRGARLREHFDVTFAGLHPMPQNNTPVPPHPTPPPAKVLRFVCLDIEAYEWAPRKLTEFGIVTYERLTRRTEHHHLIIREHGKLRNSAFAPDAKNHFVFGKSRRVSTGEAMAFLESHLRESHTALIGHALPADLGFLAKAKMRAGKRIPAALLEAIPKYDLQLLHRCRAASDRHWRLEDICRDLAVPGWNTTPHHNAGNDAALTMAAFLHLMGIQ